MPEGVTVPPATLADLDTAPRRGRGRVRLTAQAAFAMSDSTSAAISKERSRAP